MVLVAAVQIAVIERYQVDVMKNDAVVVVSLHYLEKTSIKERAFVEGRRSVLKVGVVRLRDRLIKS